MKNSGEPKATIIPTLRYKNARTMIDWLVSAFGFQEHLVIPGENDNIAHAQLTLGNGMIMLGSSVDDEFGRLQQPPGSLNSDKLYGRQDQGRSQVAGPGLKVRNERQL